MSAKIRREHRQTGVNLIPVTATGESPQCVAEILRQAQDDNSLAFSVIPSLPRDLLSCYSAQNWGMSKDADTALLAQKDPFMGA